MSTPTPNPMKAAAQEPPGFWRNLMEPALLLGLLVPGLGHLYTGRARRGLVWFVVVQALFLGGFAILGTRFWGGGMNLGASVKGLPLLYLPEVGNFLTLLLAHHNFPSPGDPAWLAAVNDAKLPVAFENLGFLLTALSGVVNFFAAAEAWRFARKPDEDPRGGLRPATAALLSWLVPGLAQWRLGERSRGVVQFIAITALFLLGVILSGGAGVDRGQVYFWYAGAILNGGGTIVGSLACSGIPMDSGSTLWDLGVTVTCVAGLVNVVVIIDAYTRAENKLEEGA